MAERYIPRGVIPAVLLPYDSELRIDEKAYRSHLRDLIAVDGVTALTTDAHASEVSSISLDEQKRVLDITLDEVGSKVPIICGIYADSAILGAKLARQAEAAGAKCLLVFPSSLFIFGVPLQRPEMIVNHFRMIAEASDLSIIIFSYAMASGLGYTTDTLVQLAEEIPQVVSVKDACNIPVQHEKNIRALHGLKKPFSVLTTHSAWLMASLVMGVDGLLSGAGSVIADLQSQLWKSVKDKDLGTAQALNDRMWQITNVFYADPFVDMHNRMKEALVLLGRQKNAYVRPPLMKLSDREIGNIRQGLIRSGLLTGCGKTGVF
jgi:4-hydroxy-tetrahydrodipicolinate synthase